MRTKAEMIEAAATAGFGTMESLRRLFVSWQEIGLLGLAAGKAKGRGAPGLWHPSQHGLWLSLLNQRARGVRLTTLTNMVAGLWLLQIEGVETEQTQRAFGFWQTGSRKLLKSIDPRSLIQRAIEEYVRRLASPAATVAAKRELRDGMRIVLDFLPKLGISEHELSRRVVAVIAPQGQGEPPVEYTSRGVVQSIRLQLLAMKYLPDLLRETKEVRAFWEWARSSALVGLHMYQQDQPSLEQLSEVGRLFGRPRFSELMNAGCSTSALALGGGLAVLLEGEPDGFPFSSPPQIRLRGR